MKGKDARPLTLDDLMRRHTSPAVFTLPEGMDLDDLITQHNRKVAKEQKKRQKSNGR